MLLVEKDVPIKLIFSQTKHDYSRKLIFLSFDFVSKYGFLVHTSDISSMIGYMILVI